MCWSRVILDHYIDCLRVDHPQAVPDGSQISSHKSTLSTKSPQLWPSY